MTSTKKDATTSTELRRCIGSTRFGIEAHEAPENEFPAQPSAKDGLGRMCHIHWRAYTNALRKAAVARKAAETTEAVEPPAELETDVAPEAPAHEHTLAASMVGEGEPIESPAPRRTRSAPDQVRAGPGPRRTPRPKDGRPPCVRPPSGSGSTPPRRPRRAARRPERSTLMEVRSSPKRRHKHEDTVRGPGLGPCTRGPRVGDSAVPVARARGLSDGLHGDLPVRPWDTCPPPRPHPKG